MVIATASVATLLPAGLRFFEARPAGPGPLYATAAAEVSAWDGVGAVSS